MIKIKLLGKKTWVRKEIKGIYEYSKNRDQSLWRTTLTVLKVTMNNKDTKNIYIIKIVLNFNQD